MEVGDQFKISVTIPVYNTSKYLRRCLDSLKSQAMTDGIEFIIVDDGSTDNSREICQQYADEDSRFRVIHKENAGLATARQAGLDAARGEYVIVCDSDDWVEPEIYQRLYEKAVETGADVVVCGYFTEYSDGRSLPTQYMFEENSGIVDNEDFLMNGAISSWVKLIKKSLFDKTNAYYEPGIDLGEDALIIFKLMKGNPKIVQIKGNYYHYRRLFGQETYTNSLNMRNVRQLERMFCWLKKNYKGDKYYKLKERRAIDIGFAYLRVADTDRTAMKKFLKEELKWKNFFKGNRSFKKIVVYLEKILPISIMKSILNLLYKRFYR